MIDDFVKELNLDGDTFDQMKKDFNIVLQRLIANMKEKNAIEGSMTLKIDINLQTEYIPNFDPDIKSESRKVQKPKFKHKITSQLQIKDEKSGNLDTEMELVMDENGVYVLRPVANTTQRSFFDTDFREVATGSTNSDEDDIEEERKALPGRKIMSLPGPSFYVDTSESSDLDEIADDENYTDDEVENAPIDLNEAMEDVEQLPYSDYDDYGYEEPED